MPEIFSNSNFLIISLTNHPVFSLVVPSKFQVYLVASRPIYGIIGGEVDSIIHEEEIGITASPESINQIAKGFDYLIKLNYKQYNRFIENSKKGTSYKI